jgi:hypothetical protein
MVAKCNFELVIAQITLFLFRCKSLTYVPSTSVTSQSFSLGLTWGSLDIGWIVHLWSILGRSNFNFYQNPTI